MRLCVRCTQLQRIRRKSFEAIRLTLYDIFNWGEVLLISDGYLTFVHSLLISDGYIRFVHSLLISDGYLTFVLLSHLLISDGYLTFVHSLLISDGYIRFVHSLLISDVCLYLTVVSLGWAVLGQDTTTTSNPSSQDVQPSTNSTTLPTVDPELTTDQPSTNDSAPARMDCQQKLLERAYSCVTKHDVDFNHFLLMAVSSLSSEANVTKPAIIEGVNMSEFKEKVCNARPDIMQCTFKAAKSLINTKACANSAHPEAVASQDLMINDQRYLIKEQMEAILGQYDIFCAQPCRISLLDDMRECYRKYDLDPAIFLPTKSSGPVIGSDSWEVDTFCKNKDQLVQCMKQKRDACPQSKLVLTAIGLDLDTMEKGFDVLCQDKEVYLKGLECFESHTDEVGICHSVKHRGVIRTSQKARELKWTSEKYFEEVCGVLVHHMECDLKAWAAKKHEKCNPQIIGLKRKLHCSLVHSQCTKSHGEVINDICNPPIQEMLYSHAGKQQTTHVLGVGVLLIMVATIIRM
ncbi:uncharacterized protein LOC131932170 [Physella acuta]|uniref:uncharacterized protein LOC131932170 n=1 Tax=Physella acuta TaxID=109671 RepID=UPI0027DE7634|nr:uncharacterized protein LOC131932170 [Physella acuta]